MGRMGIGGALIMGNQSSGRGSIQCPSLRSLRYPKPYCPHGTCCPALEERREGDGEDKNDRVRRKEEDKKQRLREGEKNEERERKRREWRQG